MLSVRIFPLMSVLRAVSKTLALGILSHLITSAATTVLPITTPHTGFTSISSPIHRAFRGFRVNERVAGAVTAAEKRPSR
jgi:hypothetical protein